MADRRVLWRNVAQSRKVNALSLKASLLWTWSIPFFDCDGFIEAEPDYLKLNVIPKRKDIQEEEIPALVDEIVDSGLWKLFKTEDGIRVAKESKFEEYQKIRKEKESASRFKKLKVILKDDIPGAAAGQTDGGPNKDKLSEVKLSKEKAKEESLRETKTENDNGAGFQKLKEPERNKETFEKIDRLRRVLSANGIFKRASTWAQMKIQLQYHPEAILLALQRVNEFKPDAPEAYADKIISIESGNFNEADYVRRAEELKKTGPSSLKEALQGAVKNAMSREMQGLPENVKPD